MAQPNRDNSDHPARWGFLALVLSGLCLVLRAPALLALPIFGDEAIYLRWAQLIRTDGGGHWWVSLSDPKPPLHFWLIAAVLKSMHDPLAAARMVSVLAGVLSVPAIMLVCAELAELSRSARVAVSGRALGLFAALLLIFCPFLAFYQRLATADALFVLEMLTAIWLALRWARLALAGRRAWAAAASLGLALGCALLTRQGLSYTLCGMPVVALALQWLKNRTMQNAHPARTPPSRRHLKAPIVQLLLALFLAGALWSPYLVAQFPSSAAENGGPVAELKRRILYQSQFTQADESHAAIAKRNFLKTFVVYGELKPDGTPAEPPEAGWFFLYLTPGVYAAVLLGLVYLLVTRQWHVFLLLAAWLALMLGPPIVLGNVIYSRYVLPGAIPLLIAAAWLLEGLLARIFSRGHPLAVSWPAAIVVLGGLLFMPLRQIGTQTKVWDEQLLTRRDRYQYLEGWTSGWATQAAIRVLRQEAARRPIVVITDWRGGNPADAVWSYLSGAPNVTLYFTMPNDQTPMILTPAPAGPANTFLLQSDKWLFTPPRPMTIPPGVPVFYITNDPVYVNNVPLPAEDFFRGKNPNLGPPIPFYGIGGPDGPPGWDRVLVFPVQ